MIAIRRVMDWKIRVLHSPAILRACRPSGINKDERAASAPAARSQSLQEPRVIPCLKQFACPAVALLVLSPMALRAQAAKPALYTADQALAGAAIYDRSCVSCHGAGLAGVSGPALKGAPFGETAAAENLSADALLEVILASMPQSDPGSLTPQDAAAVTAYILQQNGYPAGATTLARGAAGLKDIKVTP